MSANQQQTEHWNSTESNHWVEHAQRYDRQLAPFADVLIEQGRFSDGDRVLDVGCGCGATTIAAAQHSSHATGVDLSRPMLDVARRRASVAGRTNVDFVAAFTNVRRALTPGRRFAFVCWQGLEVNEWLLVPGLAAAQHVALPDLSANGGPGMFSLATADAINDTLARAGFRDIQIDPLNPTITLGGGGTVDESLDYLLGTSIARALLDSAEPDARVRAIDAVRVALTEHYEPGIGARLGTGAWLARGIAC